MDDQRMVVVAYDEIYVYDMSSEKPIYTRKTQTSIFKLEYFDGIALVAVHSSSIGLTLDIMKGQWISIIDLEDFTRYICASSNRMITGNLKGTIKLWDIRSGKCLRRHENANPVSAVALRLSFMITCCLEGDVFLFDYGNGQLIRRLFTIGYSWVRKFTTFVADDTKIVVPLKGCKPNDCLAIFHFDSDDYQPRERSKPLELIQPQLTYRFAKRIHLERKTSNGLH
ncbi:F-box/WD repeat-containing protein 7 [Galendromus occidentalis]|uniref:F-box/WD repeat-containing protein 7 n=1 Tax=Galendromus occidentalis TaxID=34638 RepID=A0AAJ6QS12_9ACAR|nr:F-box/WD repeat-containing protein 7 [Galendromus occidentalis]